VSTKFLLQRLMAYLDGQVTGKDLVRTVDDIVSSDAVYETNKVVEEIILKYQDKMSLYVEDAQQRSEHPAYFGPVELRRIATELKRDLEAVRNCWDT